MRDVPAVVETGLIDLSQIDHTALEPLDGSVLGRALRQALNEAAAPEMPIASFNSGTPMPRSWTS